jgi:S-adenosyl methyltransferase
VAGPDDPAALRIYDYWGGGLDNWAADRDLAEKIEQISPGLRRMVGVSRAFTARAVECVGGRALSPGET